MCEFMSAHALVAGNINALGDSEDNRLSVIIFVKILLFIGYCNLYFVLFQQ
jgi:hypothetical protein